MKKINSFIHFLFFTFLICGQALAQNAAILPQGKTQFLDNNGNPLSSGKVYFYIPSTTTNKTTWQDAGKTTPNTNPVNLDAGGRAIIYGDGTYRQIVRDRNNNIIYDAVTASAGTGGGTTGTGDGDLVGTIKPWAGLQAPNQYAFAYGQEVSRTTFSVLFTAVTLQQTITCSIGSPTATGFSDTQQIPTGGVIESLCFAPGTTVVSKTATTVTFNNNSSLSTVDTARIFLYGNGNGSTTFNLPDLRGRVSAGRDNMGGTSANRLQTTYFGMAGDATGATGGNQSKTLITGNLPPYTPAGSVTAAGNIVFSSSGTNSYTPSGTNASSATSGLISSFVFPTGAGGSSNRFLTDTNTGLTGNISLSGGTANAQTFTGNAVTATFSNSGSSFSGNAQGGTSTPLSVIQPTMTLNYIVKITPDSNSADASGVTSLGGMTGDIACGTGLLCTGNVISATSANLVINSTAISGGTSNGILYNSSGVLENTASSNNSVLVTNVSGVPSLSATLPTAVQTNITQLGTLTTTLNITPSSTNRALNPISSVLSGSFTPVAPIMFNSFYADWGAQSHYDGVSVSPYNSNVAAAQSWLNLTSGALCGACGGHMFVVNSTDGPLATGTGFDIASAHGLNIVNVTATFGNFYGSIWSTRLGASAVVGSAIGQELGVAGLAGAAINGGRVVQRLINDTDGATQGTAYDTFWMLSNAGTSAGAFRDMLLLSNNYGAAPLATTANMFRADTAYTIANVFNMPNLTVTGDIHLFPNLRVKGDGGACFGCVANPGAGNIAAGGVFGAGIYGVSTTGTSKGAIGLIADVDGATNSTRIDLQNTTGNNFTFGIIGNEPSRTTTRYGITLGNWMELSLFGASANGLIIGTNTNTPIVFGQNNVEVARINSTGLGIGGSPLGKLSAAGTGFVEAITRSTDNTVSSGSSHVAQANGSAVILAVNAYAPAATVSRWGLTLGGYTELLSIGASSAGLLMGTNNATSVIIGTNNTQRLTVNSSGALRAHAYGAGTLVTDTSGNITATNPVGLLAATSVVNFNTGNTDYPINITLPPGFTRWRLQGINVSSASASLTTSTGSVWSGTGGTGYNFVASATANTVNTASNNTANNLGSLAAIGAATTSFDYTTIYYRVQTPQGSAATGSVTLTYFPLP